MSGRNLSGGIYETLTDRIHSWSYPPGQRLTEEELCSEFSVSRSPVREALGMLVEADLVEKEDRKGYRVRRVDLREVNECYDARLVLEVAVAEKLCADGMDETLRSSMVARWRELSDLMPAVAESAALEDENFHETLASAAGNRVIQRLLKDVDRRVHFVRLSDITDPERLRTTCSDHLEILDALGRRDRAAAVSVLRRNIEWGREKVQTAIKEALARAHGLL